jgi:hypothetical protein
MTHSETTPMARPDNDLPTHRTRPLPVQLQEAHPEWVRELAFVCWVQADRNAARARHLMEEHWPEATDGRVPPYRTIAAWVQRGNWDAKADELVAANFPGLTMRHTARLVHMAGLALTTAEEVISGDGFLRDEDGNLVFDRNGRAVIIDPRHQRNRLDGATKILELAGVGTAGSRNRTAPVVRAVVTETRNLAEMSEEELAELQLQLLRDGKTHPALAERKS